MVFVLKVIGGSDEGKLFRVEPGENLIGRSPTATIQLKDESVAWEHAVVQDEGGKVSLSNLSALGTRVRGRRVDDKVRLRPRDEVQLSDSCRILLEERAGAGAETRSRLLSSVLVAALVLVVLAGGLYALLSSGGPPVRPITDAHWREAYNRLGERIDQWVLRGWFPREGAEIFAEGWRLEHADNYRSALEKWNALRSLLLTARLPVSPERQTFNELSGRTHRALLAVMKYTMDSDAGGMQASSDETFADALVWFARHRATLCERQVQAEEKS